MPVCSSKFKAGVFVAPSDLGSIGTLQRKGNKHGCDLERLSNVTLALKEQFTQKWTFTPPSCSCKHVWLSFFHRTQKKNYKMFRQSVVAFKVQKGQKKKHHLKKKEKKNQIEHFAFWWSWFSNTWQFLYGISFEYFSWTFNHFWHFSVS